MKHLFYYLLTIAISLPALAQAQNPTNSGDMRDGFKIMRGEAEGTPFLTEKWFVGYGVFDNGETSRPQQMNYDIHGNNLVYKTAGNDNVLKLLDNRFTGFILKTDEGDYLFTKIKGSQFDKKKDETKYYKVVQAPSTKVIIEYKKDLDDPNASGWQSSQQNTKNAEYDLKMDYYVQRKDGKYEEVKLNNRKVLKVFKDKKDQLEKYMASNSIDIETPEDLLQVTEYYHSL